jgi:cysteine desulfurase
MGEWLNEGMSGRTRILRSIILPFPHSTIQPFHPVVYLDNSATTPMADEVVARVESVRREVFGNASSVHRYGQRARVELEDAREVIARALGAEPREVIFTSGGTEANNAAIKGYAVSCRTRTGALPAIITARTEHHAVLGPAELFERLGATVRYVDVDADGRVAPERLRDVLASVDRSAPPLVSIMHANNETGTINPIAALAVVAHEMGAVVHSDAVQSFGKVAVSGDALGVDMLTISAHKIHGPRGIGALYLRKEIEIEPLVHGGSQERNRRGGTEAVDLVAGFAEAVRLAQAGLAENAARMQSLIDRLRTSLVERIAGVRVITPRDGSLPNILSITFDDAAALDGEALIVGMDLRGVAVSNGSACTSGSPQPSHVLLAMGLAPEQARAAVRFSISRYTTASDIDVAVEALAEVLGVMRAE